MNHEFRLARRETLQWLAWGWAAGQMPWMWSEAQAAGPRVGEEGKLPDDARLGELKDYNGYFPFTPSATPEEWSKRAEYVKRQMLLACGLWPMPERPAVKAAVHGKVEREGYSVERVYFESSPGLYVTGSLYRPADKKGPMPAILCPHGHWAQGRFHDHGEAKGKQEVAAGAEKFESGRHPLQARCVQLARMGCMVFHYDMLGYADSPTISFELAHRFAKQRPELSRPDHWGLFSAQAELRLLNILGLQTFNSIRALDWVSSLPEADSKRLGVTGASGGGTQSFMLAALDDRISAAFPAVMVSTAMQGGCTCENASFLRVNTGNIEFAALVAPRPIGMSAADDWTKELETKGLPELKQHFKMMGVPDSVEGKHFPFPHNYNYVSRAMMYEFFNRHFKLGLESPIVETDFQPLSTAELTVWNDQHPKPASDDAAEVAMLKKWDQQSQKQLAALTPRNAETLAEFRRVVGRAWEVMIGRPLPAAEDIEYERIDEIEGDGYTSFPSWLRNKKHGEQLPTVFLLPKIWNKQVVLWISEQGKAGVFDAEGKPTAAVAKLLKAGAAVAAVDLLYQGEFLADGQPLTEARVVKNPREFVGYTAGFNHPLFAQRVHDILSLLSYVKHHPKQPDRIDLVGFGPAAPWVLAACALADDTVRRVAVDTHGFRFAQITHHRDPQLIPGAIKYGDLPGLAALCASHPLWVAGEGAKAPELLQAALKSAGTVDQLVLAPSTATADDAAKWLLQ